MSASRIIVFLASQIVPDQTARIRKLICPHWVHMSEGTLSNVGMGTVFHSTMVKLLEQ